MLLIAKHVILGCTYSGWLSRFRNVATGLNQARMEQPTAPDDADRRSVAQHG